jgi:hypothetical protein
MPAWSGLYNSVHGVDYSLIGVANPFRRLRRVFGARASALKAKEIVRTFVTDDVGTTAAWTHKRVGAQTGAVSTEIASSLGGVRSVETVTDINRALTSADETALLLEIDAVHTPASWPTEKSGNSGGGKLGF